MTKKRLGSVALMGAFAALAAFSCSKDKDTLVVVALMGQPAAPGLTSTTVTIGATTKMFHLTGGLSTVATSVGVYIPPSVTSPVGVTAVATGAGLCYRGTGQATFASAGTEADVSITLVPDTTCASAGTAGQGGTAGAGTAGSGVAGAGTAGASTDGGAGSGAAGAGTAGASTDGGAGSGAAGAGTAGASTDGGAGSGAAGAATVLAWSAATDIVPSQLVSSQWSRVAISPTHGDVLLAYVSDQFPAVKRYDATKKLWGDEKVLDNRGDVEEVNVAMDDTGHALVSWVQYDGADPPAEIKGIWFCHSEDGGVTWSAPARIHQGPAWGDLAIGMASDGSARVAWDETDGTTRTLWSSSYDPVAKTFATAAQVKLGTDVYERHARIAVAPGGHGVLVWIQPDAADKDSVWGATFTTPGGALTTPVLVDSYIADDNANQSVAISSDGTHAIVAWEQTSMTSEDIWTSDWTPTGGFTAEKLAITGSGIAGPAVAIDASYTVTMAWSQRANSGHWQVTAGRRLNGQPWGTPTVLETTNQAGDYIDEIAYSHAACDAAGNVHVLWRRKMHAVMTEDTYGVFVRRYSNAVWAPEVQLGVKEGLPAFDENLAVASDGRAAATFFYGDPDAVGDPEAYNVFAALFK